MQKERRLSFIIAIISGVLIVIAAIIGAWIQSGGFNPPPKSHIVVLSQGINYTSNRYWLLLYNKGNAISGDIFLRVIFHPNISIKYETIYCNVRYTINQSEKTPNSFILEWKPILPKQQILINIPFQVYGKITNKYLIDGVIQPVGEKMIDLTKVKLWEYT